jgi:transposase
MQILCERCCGLDVHKRLVVACVLIGPPGRPVEKEIRTFETMTGDLLELSDWLLSRGVTHIALESTGVYWKPIWNLLEDTFTLLLVNAQHVKAVPGRKTDVRDAEWLAELLRHGLLQGSFVPDRPQRELRELIRYRTSLVRERATVVNRIQKTLEGVNIKLASVATDILGKSGRQILEALTLGATDAPELAQLAQLARGRLRDKIPQLERALAGRFGPHQRFLLAEHLALLDALEASLERVSTEIAERVRPFDEAIERLQTIPGVGRRVAEVIVTEVGVDVSRFPTAGHLASWAGLCPGQHESAGKRHSGRTRHGNASLRTALVEAAQAASHTKATYLAAQFHRLAARRGRKKAAIAVAHSILVIAYHLLARGTTYQDLGVHYFDERDRRAVERRAVRRLEGLGFKVILEPAA